MIPEKTVGRLSQYRRIINELLTEGVEQLHSHQLAAMAGVNAAQVRRDLMSIGAEGSPKRGYRCARLIENLRAALDHPEGRKVALIGIGNLGRALLTYFIGRRPGLEVVAAFDVDPSKCGRVINGCRCYPMEQLDSVLAEQQIRVAVIAVPASQAQAVAQRLLAAKVNGIVNFAPVPLHLPPQVYVENIDVTMSLEKVAYFALKRT